MDTKKILEMLDNRINTVWDNIWGNPSYIRKYWEDLSNEFKGASEDEVIEFLDSLDDIHLRYVIEIGEELFDLFRNSKTFYRRMYELQEKHKVNMYLSPPDE